MAFNTGTDRALKISIDLSYLVSSQLDVVLGVRKRDRAEKEAKFQQTVIDQGLSYEAQIEYRKEQISKEKESSNLDGEYVTSLETDVRSLRKLNRFKKIREDYLDNYEDLKSGKINLTQHATFLQQQLAESQDEDARKEIRDELSNVRGQIAEAEINTLKNRVLVAKTDGTVNVLNETIDNVAKRKAFADLNGNTEESSMWDVSLTSLRKQVSEVNVANSLHDIDLSISRKAYSAIQKVDTLNAEIAKAEGNTPITVNGITYRSAREYWVARRDNYLNGMGDDKNFQNFLRDIEGEVKDKIDTVAATTRFNFVPLTTLDAIKNDYAGLAGRPEFANLLPKLETSRQAALAYGVDKSATAIIESSIQTLQVKTGQSLLDQLQNQFGIDLAGRKVELDEKIIQKGSQLPSIKEAQKQLKGVGAETPSATTPDNLTPTSIFNQKEIKDLSGIYKRDKTTGAITNKNTGITHGNEQSFFNESGVKSFENLKFEEFATPAATPAPNAAPISTAPRKFSKSSQGFNSIVDFLASEKSDTSLGARAKLYEEVGLGAANLFKGTAEQNVALLKKFN